MGNTKTFPDKQCRFCGGKMFISMQVCPVCGKRQHKMTTKEAIDELDCNIEPLTCSCGSMKWMDIRHLEGEVTIRCIRCRKVFILPWVDR